MQYSNHVSNKMMTRAMSTKVTSFPLDWDKCQKFISSTSMLTTLSWLVNQGNLSTLKRANKMATIYGRVTTQDFLTLMHDDVPGVFQSVAKKKLLIIGNFLVPNDKCITFSLQCLKWTDRKTWAASVRRQQQQRHLASRVARALLNSYCAP